MSADQSTIAPVADECPFRSDRERLPTRAELHELLELLPDGRLRWRSRRKKFFSWSGRDAFTAINADGYRCGKVAGVMALAHRVVFKMAYGYEPVEVDHKDGDRLNNHPDNLIPADKTVNGRNQKLRCTNTSGVCGVTWLPIKKRWVAKIRIGGGRRLTLGEFARLEDAAAARKRAEEEYGYSARHGKNQASTAQDSFSETV